MRESGKGYSRTKLTLAKTDELYRASESMQVRMKVVGSDNISAHAIKVDRYQRSSGASSKTELPSKSTLAGNVVVNTNFIREICALRMERDATSAIN